ncbi:MAG: cell envelope integrity protein TolA [Gammaproteobacteria bacterium]|nr:MAG: cell envelope integrity protein TolA [Gammaproteobacteria bacterium]
MLKRGKSNARPAIFSIALHVLVIGALFASFRWDSETRPVGTTRVEPVKAILVDDARVQAEMRKLQELEKKKKATERARKRKADKALADAKRKRKQEEKRLAEVKKKRLTAEKKRKQEQRRLDKLRKDKIALEKEQREQTKRQAAAEKKRKQEVARKKREQEKRRREEEMQKQLAAEEAERRELEMQGVIKRHIAIITAKVQRSWIKPAFNVKGLKCVVRVNLIPSGEVVGVKIVQSSGNVIFDRSVETAVRKASPLPLPKDPRVMALMREISFVFSPEE